MAIAMKRPCGLNLQFSDDEWYSAYSHRPLVLSLLQKYLSKSFAHFKIIVFLGIEQHKLFVNFGY